MSVATMQTTMLYCPKCRSTYEEGSQRFCSNDGGRLLPVAPRSDAAKPAGGVFSNILGKMPHKDASDRTPHVRPVPVPRFEQPPKPEAPKSATPISRIYETQMRAEMVPFDDDSILELDFDEPLDAPLRREPSPEPFGLPITEIPADEPQKSVFEPESPIPAPRLVDPSEISSGTADVGDRAAQPAGRIALSWQNPRVLVGQTIKGRYQVTELMGDAEDALEFLAEDRINAGKRVSVRVYLDDDAYSESVADERVILAHLDHPNIAAVFDSGELPEGFPFTIAEFVDGQSLADALRSSGQFNTKRTARIIRQASYALSAAHENGILHRNLKPENLMLTVSEAGIELVKLINFEQSNEFWNESDLVYKSPEEIAGELPTFASETWTLAVIAYEMLTARLPFNALSERDLLAAQEQGITTAPSTLRPDVTELADRILEKALSFDPPGRYPKARDFGDAFFNALTAVSTFPDATAEPEAKPEPATADEKAREFVVVPPIVGKPAEETPVSGDIHIAPSEEIKAVPEMVEPETAENDEHAWQKRSPEPPRTANWIWGVLPVIGALLLLVALWGVWKFLASRPPQVSAPETANSELQPIQTPETMPILPPEAEVDRPPVPRTLKAEEGLTRFVNVQAMLKGDLAKHFLGFEIFYPQEMKRSESATNFLDVATRNEAGVPLEQMIVTHYPSRGTMTLDRPNFKKLADSSNAKLKELVGDSFRVVGEGETAIQNGRWKGYEVKFEGKLPDGKTRLFGRRLWIPVQSPGVQNGFVITLLATSLADGIGSVDDVGNKGLLSNAIENFEPEQ